MNCNTACKRKGCAALGKKPGVVSNPSYKRGLKAWTVSGLCASCGGKFHAFIPNALADTLGLESEEPEEGELQPSDVSSQAQ